MLLGEARRAIQRACQSFGPCMASLSWGAVLVASAVLVQRRSVSWALVSRAAWTRCCAVCGGCAIRPCGGILSKPAAVCTAFRLGLQLRFSGICSTSNYRGRVSGG